MALATTDKRLAMRSWLPLLVLVGVTLYALALAALFVEQRRMMYFPTVGGVSAAGMGLERVETLALATSDGETIVAWHRPPAPGFLLFLYFHGNGGRLPDYVERLRRLSADGSGFLAIDYRGYGGSTGSPSETGLLIDGETAYAKALALGYTPDRIVVLGESLGTGVAVAVASDHPCKALVLDSAFSASADVAAATYWMFPVQLLMRDTFRSKARIAHIQAPKLFVHGSDDPIIPIAFDRKLFDAAPAPKTFLEVPGGRHVVIWAPPVFARVKAWLAEQP